MRNKRLKSWFCALALLLLSCNLFARDDTGPNVITASSLPLAAQHTLMLIEQGGPFPYSKDGTVFGNYEKKLPRQRRGYYREYTVKTPGVRHRGARRLIAGGEVASPSEFFYTADHYQTFQRIRK